MITGKSERRRCGKRETGFEPATSTLARLHSTTELLPQTKADDTQMALDCQLSLGSSRGHRDKIGGGGSKIVREEVFEMGQLGRGVGLEQETDDIEAVRLISKGEETAVEAGSANDAEAFALVDGGLWAGELVIPSRLDFQEDEDCGGEGQVIRDEVDLALDGAPVWSPTDRATKVARDNLIALGDEIAGRELLAELSQLPGRDLGRYGTAREPARRSSQPTPPSLTEETDFSKMEEPSPQEEDRQPGGEKSPPPVRADCCLIDVVRLGQGRLRTSRKMIFGVGE